MPEILAPGKNAPEFTLRVTPDQELGLRDLRGRPVIIAFYPADWSPVCGDQMALYNQILPEFRRQNAELVGISVEFGLVPPSLCGTPPHPLPAACRFPSERRGRESIWRLSRERGRVRASAFAAALRMREAMDHLNAERGGQDLLLKIGIHEGPCLAVMLNDRQDYFGQTVNIASRVQHLALSQAIFASGSVVTDPNGSAILTNSGVVPIPRQAALRGITDEFEVYELPLGAPQDRSARG